MNVKKYLNQLISDIQTATVYGTETYANSGEEAIDLLVWEEQVETIPTQALDEWCSIKQNQLPPDTQLNEEQVSTLLGQLKLLLDAYNCPIVFQFRVPHRLQYQVIRANFNQQVPIVKVRHFTFSFCDESVCREACLLGAQYCHCLFFDDFFDKFAHDKESKDVEVDINPYKQYLLKRRYGADWLNELLPEDSEPWKEEDDREESTN